MRVLVACEYSGRVRDAFLRMGHDAVSCDLLDTDVPGPHYKGDVADILGDGWDLMIAHPPCTYLTVAGLHWNKRDPSRAALTEEALDFVRLLMAAPIKRKAIENPVSCISSRIRKPDQIIQPHEFGEDASKKTCLWLEGLPKLHIDPAWRRRGRFVEWPRGSGKLVERWSNQTDSGQNALPPSEDRWKIRSETYPAIAAAFAAQWGGGAIAIFVTIATHTRDEPMTEAPHILTIERLPQGGYVVHARPTIEAGFAAWPLAAFSGLQEALIFMAKTMLPLQKVEEPSE